MHRLLTADVEHAASELDRQWFLDNPGVDVRCRPALSGELASGVLPPAPGAECWVKVVQLAPGLRTRYVYWVVNPAVFN